MSGPIVRKYGFPNFEKIFGERPLEHGADEGIQSSEQAAPAKPKAAGSKEKKAAPKATKKKSK